MLNKSLTCRDCKIPHREHRGQMKLTPFVESLLEFVYPILISEMLDYQPWKYGWGNAAWGENCLREIIQPKQAVVLTLI
jgi:hypothetical protein